MYYYYCYYCYSTAHEVRIHRPRILLAEQRTSYSPENNETHQKHISRCSPLHHICMSPRLSLRPTDYKRHRRAEQNRPSNSNWQHHSKRKRLLYQANSHTLHSSTTGSGKTVFLAFQNIMTPRLLGKFFSTTMVLFSAAAAFLLLCLFVQRASAK